MPLFDFRCRTCDALSTQLVKAEATVACPECGSLSLEKLVAPFAFRTSTTAAAPAPEAAPKAQKETSHVCTSGCQHGTAEKLVKKYLG